MDDLGVTQARVLCFWLLAREIGDRSRWVIVGR
jgi:hypothetical protein